MAKDEVRDCEYFIQFIGDHYDQIKKQMRAYCFNQNKPWDEDIFQNTILKCYTTIEKQGTIKDKSDQGILNYFFMSFKTNIIREEGYAYKKYRDDNVDTPQLYELYEDYKNLFELTEDEKVLLDMYKDYAVKYILEQVEKNFSDIDYRLFSIKLYYKCTYKRLKEMTKIKDVKTRVMRINEWIKTNITKNEIQKSFDEYVENIS